MSLYGRRFYSVEKQNILADRVAELSFLPACRHGDETKGGCLTCFDDHNDLEFIFIV